MEIEQEVVDQVHVQYTVKDGIWTYQDTMVFTPEEYEAETEETIKAKQNDKYAKWKAYVTAPQKKPSREELAARLSQIEEQKAALDIQANTLRVQVEKAK